MKRLVGCRIFGFGAVFSVLIAACQRPASSPQATTGTTSPSAASCQTIAHTAGTTEICDSPQRIIALGPYILEPLVALGVQPVGFADHAAFGKDTYDNPSQQIPYIGDRVTSPVENVGAAFTPSLETIARVQPDLIVGTEFNAQQYESLSKIGPTILLEYSNAEDNLKLLAQAVDKSEAAEQLIAQTKQKVIEARETFSEFVSLHQKALLLFSRSQTLSLSENDQELCNTIAQEIGFQIVSLSDSESINSEGSATPISSEQLSKLNDADVIIVLGSNFDEFESTHNYEDDQLSEAMKVWEENAIAQSLDASKAGRVYFIPAYLCLGLPGPIGTELYIEELQEQLLSNSTP